jgi:hypothetical protein
MDHQPVLGGGVPTKVRVFGLKKLFLKRFTVRSTTRTLITDKNDHSAFTPIIFFDKTIILLLNLVLKIRKNTVFLAQGALRPRYIAVSL